MPELHRYSRAGVTLAEAASDAILSLLGDRPVALLTGRTRFRVVSGADIAHDGEFADVYAARIFGPGGELRWRDEIGEEPLAVLVLRESPDARLPGWAPAGAPLRWITSIEQRYLLWGEIVETPADAHVVHEARIGAFEIPAAAVAAGPNDRLQLVSYELLGHGDSDDPNTRVVEELLSHFEVGDTAWPHGIE